MKLTKLQRYTAYCILLFEVEEKAKCPLSYYGLCLLIAENFFWDTDEIEKHQWTEVIELFPEIMKRKPVDANRFWFTKDQKGWQQRVELVNQCITETHP